MSMFFRLAWRNIWRNPKRTLIILAAIVIGVWCMIFMAALTRGSAESMVQNNIATLTGEIQIHAQGYRNDPVIENSMHDPEGLQAVLDKILPPGSRSSARVRVGGVASNARHSTGVTIVGVDPESEAAVSFMGKAPLEGSFLGREDGRGIVIGHALLEKFETRLGNKIVLMSQAENGEIASRSFKIVGVYRAELEATEKAYVFIPRGSAQEMLGMGSALSEVSIVLPDRSRVDMVTESLRQALSGSPNQHYEVLTWVQILKMLTSYLEMFDSFMLVWYIVVFMAMGFGIVNTTLMAVLERVREFGLLKALGMRPISIVKQVMAESLFLLAMGTILGTLLAAASCWALSRNGINLSAMAEGSEYLGMSKIIYPLLLAKDIIMANGVVFFLGLLVSAYPAIKAARFTPVEALAHT